MELLRRVGLEGHIHHKGSKLSGGQKQRTVIARALAKDSPILLCDEPTGNLDSKSSAEIIELLREVSRDKLVIIVTHNFEQVENYATRHIRIFDGAVESDRVIRPGTPPSGEAAVSADEKPVAGAAYRLRCGLHLGRVRFTAKPKLSIFLCVLMAVTMLTVTLITSVTYDARDLLKNQQMFTYVKGRVVITRRDGSPMTDADVEKLASELGAVDHLHYDSMLDETVLVHMGEDYDRYLFSFGYPAESVTLTEGRYPERDDEVILEVPISAKPHLGNPFRETELPLLFGMANYKVVGVRYYYDNTRTPRMLFTENGYRLAAAMAFFSKQGDSFSYDLRMKLPEGVMGSIDQSSILLSGETFVDFELGEGTYFINNENFGRTVKNMLANAEPKILRSDILINTALKGEFVDYRYGGYYGYDYYYTDFYAGEMAFGGYGETVTVSYPLDAYGHTFTLSETMKKALEMMRYETWSEDLSCVSGVSAVILSPDIFMDFMYEKYYAQSYTQASLFFRNDREAHDMAEKLREMGYVAVVSDETVEPDVFYILEEKLGAAAMAVLWALAILFATLFLSLCSSRAMNSTRGDIAIMRSMGIPTAVVRISIYVQTLLSLIPAVAVTAVTCGVVYLLPATNRTFPFLHAADYLLIAAVIVLIALNLSRKYVKQMFQESVKKTLKGGSRT
jgi:energy-coupling factor transporter ATP-binding protein EcfA2